MSGQTEKRFSEPPKNRTSCQEVPFQAQVGRRAVVGGAWLGGRGVVARGAMRNRHRTSAPDGSPPTPAGQAWPPPSYVPSATTDLALQWDHVWRRKVPVVWVVNATEQPARLRHCATCSVTVGSRYPLICWRGGEASEVTIGACAPTISSREPGDPAAN